MLSRAAVLIAATLLFHLVPFTFATPLQLHVPTLFNSAQISSTTLPLINATLTNATFVKEEPCFLPSPDRLPVKSADCEKAAREMARGKGDRIYNLGRGSGVTYQLPKSFINGTCFLTLDMIYEDETDGLRFPQIQEAVDVLARRCASTYFDRGGIVAVGPRKVLYVTIFGTDIGRTS